MARRRVPPAHSLAAQTAALALAVPQVVSHRMGRMALAGPQPSARDQREFMRMGHEKTAAFFESWWAMGWQVMRLQQQAWMSMFGVGRSPWTGQGAQRAMAGILGTGLAPVSRRAVANAKRLSKTRP